MWLAGALVLLLAPALAERARPCRTNPLCYCLADHFACNHVAFYRFPETDADVSHVSVSGARLHVLADAALDGRALRTLVVVASHMHHIDTRALHSMVSTLASLDLGHNEFTEIPVEALRALRVLNWLNLQNNYISEIDPDTNWGHLTEVLSILSLSNNELAVLRPGALSGLRGLTRLELSGNRLRALAPGSLPLRLALLPLDGNLLSEVPCAATQLPRLRHLQLRNNRLRVTSNACTVDTYRIESIDLSNNDLEDGYIPDLHTNSLKQIILDYNNINAIPSFVLNSSRLEKLSLCQNKLKHVTDGEIYALKETLVRLDLDRKQLNFLPKSFSEMSHLRQLSAAYNRLREVKVLPPKLRLLSLAGNFLTCFPAGLRDLPHASLTLLDLSYNRITAIMAKEFNEWSRVLTTLNLRGNNIAELTADAFLRGLPLQELMLSFNKLQSVSRVAMLNLSELYALELSTSAVAGELTYISLPSTLSWVSLDNNDINFNSWEGIQNFSSLEYLNLDFNKITEFRAGKIDTNSSNKFKLKELKLSYNYLQYVDIRVFKNFELLQSLDLSNNQICNISEFSFNNFLNLTFISLAENSLEHIDVRSFVDLPKLEVVDLSYNKLKEFSAQYFENVSSDECNLSVNVSYNSISKLSGGLGPISISVLDLSHNLLGNLSKSFFDSVGSSIRHLLISNNRISQLHNFELWSMPRLVMLNLQNNNISVVKKFALSQCVSLQSLDLSGGALSQMSGEELRSLRQLFSLSLHDNRLRALPRLVFRHTPLERLDLSHNRLVMFPASALAYIGFTLRSLDLAKNHLEYLDGTMFHAISFLEELNLAENSFTVISDNTFTDFAHIVFLDLSQNTVKTNFKELFNNFPRLRRLKLSSIGLTVFPCLPLNNLTYLDISNNQIIYFRESDVRRLSNLRTLDVSRNRITTLQPTTWTALSRLTALDVSHNPIVRVIASSFNHLSRLLHLRMDGLPQLELIEPRAFSSLLSLRSLTIDTPLSNVRVATSITDILSEIEVVESLVVHVRDRVLNRQLHGLRAVKLRALEIRGAALERVTADAFSSLSRQRWLSLRLVRTSVSLLPAGLIARLTSVQHLALELIDNRLVALEIQTLYPNLTDWKHQATKLLTSGLVVSDKYLTCGCGMSWVSAWLRRWMAEAGGWSSGARGVARRSRCAGGGARLLALRADAACTANTQSARAPFHCMPCFSCSLALLLLLSLEFRGT